MPPMNTKRSRAAAVINDQGNMWVIGGTNGEVDGLNSTEIYEYIPKGKGKWKKGPDLPPGLEGGLESHCAVRYK